MLRNALAAAFISAAALATALSLPARAQPGPIKLGTLACSLSSGVGMVVGSQRNVNCNFQPENGPPEGYTGTMTRIGLDIGVTSGGKIIWAVFTTSVPGAPGVPGLLTGQYIGATAEASIAVGLGANILVGGSNDSVALQPLSVQGQVGLNVAAGIGELSLHMVP